MKTNIAMVIFATLFISACSSAPKTTTAPEETGSAAATTVQPASPQSATAQVQAPAESAVSTDALATRQPVMQKESIYFEYDTAAVKAEYHALIQQQAEFMKAQPNVVITLEGNADERGSPEYNLALGSKRADSVRKNLEVLGVSSRQINTVSFGEEKPKLSCHEERCWGENRRVDFIGKPGN